MSDIIGYFGVTENDLRTVVTEALSGGGSYADLYFENSLINNLSLRDGAVNRVSSDVDFGMGVRVLSGDRTGYAYTENITLADMLKAARTAANIANSKTAAVPPLKISEKRFKNYYPVEKSWEDVTVKDKAPFLQKLNDRIFELDSHVCKVNVRLSDSSSYIVFFNSEGLLCSDYRPMVSLSAVCVMEKNGRIENGYAARSFRKGVEFLTGELVETIAQSVVRQTSLMFEAVIPKGGEMPVVMAAGSSGILLHEAIGHSFEADFNRKKTSIFSEKLGKQVCDKSINIVDDGTLPENRGTVNFDDEGIESQKTYLVREGVLSSYIHDRISAEHYRVAPTGNGRRESFRHAPIPRMRTTYMENGNISESDIIAGVKNGIYVSSFSNGEVQIGAGDFTFFVKSGCLIENGKLTQPVKDINIIGNGPKALADIAMVGNNLKIDHSTWTCGKDGQGVPVSQGLPSVLVKKLIVGGTAK
ncbi:MAG: TldD/PmbA family protein [Prevotellaceae bacterium]|jgi:TldD protein|nr:TldD/PmbA family protein [Prevotellaceae bacterium]